MLRPVEIAIALRYMRSRNKNRFISFISLISVFGIAIAVAVLIIVLSVMNGFEYEVRTKILSVVSHGAITSGSGRLDNWEEIEAIAERHPETASVARFVSGQGMLVGEEKIKGVQVRGVHPESELRTSGFQDMMESGDLVSLESGAYRIVIGRALADLLEADIGDKLILIISRGVTTPAGLVPRMRRFEISGIFNAGMYEYDQGLALINVEDAARLFQLGDAVSGVRLAVRNPMRAASTVREIAQSLGRDVFITDWTRQHANFFRSIQLTKSIIYMILLLVIAVAAFNIVSTLVMVVREKHAEIAILRTLGSPPAGILSIFVAQGAVIGCLGTSLGVIMGVVFTLNLSGIVVGVEKIMGFKFLAPDIYFISDFPTRIEAGDVFEVALIGMVLSFVSTMIPAWKAAIMAPAEALRHD
jgi:lipoprotein-releasing system permease protein